MAVESVQKIGQVLVLAAVHDQVRRSLGELLLSGGEVAPGWNGSGLRSQRFRFGDTVTAAAAIGFEVVRALGIVLLLRGFDPRGASFRVGSVQAASEAASSSASERISTAAVPA